MERSNSIILGTYCSEYYTFHVSITNFFELVLFNHARVHLNRKSEAVAAPVASWPQISLAMGGARGLLVNAHKMLATGAVCSLRAAGSTSIGMHPSRHSK